MKPLTDKEIAFIKETKWSPTLVQMDYTGLELQHTPYAGRDPKDAKLIYEMTAKRYGIDLTKLYKKTCDTNESDGISLEFDAAYLFYTFFDPEELVDMDTEWATKWLQDFKYYFGYRKWSERLTEIAIIEALEVHGGSREFYITDDGNIWNKKKED